MKNLTEEQIDNKILDHADEIIKLMKLKGWTDPSRKGKCACINLWIHTDIIQVDHIGQRIATLKRKKK